MNAASKILASKKASTNPTTSTTKASEGRGKNNNNNKATTKSKKVMLCERVENGFSRKLLSLFARCCYYCFCCYSRLSGIFSLLQ